MVTTAVCLSFVRNKHQKLKNKKKRNGRPEVHPHRVFFSQSAFGFCLLMSVTPPAINGDATFYQKKCILFSKIKSKFLLKSQEWLLIKIWSKRKTKPRMEVTAYKTKQSDPITPPPFMQLYFTKKSLISTKVFI